MDILSIGSSLDNKEKFERLGEYIAREVDAKNVLIAVTTKDDASILWTSPKSDCNDIAFWNAQLMAKTAVKFNESGEKF